MGQDLTHSPLKAASIRAEYSGRAAGALAALGALEALERGYRFGFPEEVLGEFSRNTKITDRLPEFAVQGGGLRLASFVKP